MKNREAWLIKAVHIFKDVFANFGCDLPKGIFVSCSFPSHRSRTTTKGQIIFNGLDNIQILICPSIDNTADVLLILGEQLVHACIGHNVHNSKFLNLNKKLLSKHRVFDLGPYPHEAIVLKPTQITANLKVVCPKGCGAKFNTSKKQMTNHKFFCGCQLVIIDGIMDVEKSILNTMIFEK